MKARLPSRNQNPPHRPKLQTNKNAANKIQAHPLTVQAIWKKFIPIIIIHFIHSSDRLDNGGPSHQFSVICDVAITNEGVPFMQDCRGQAIANLLGA